MTRSSDLWGPFALDLEPAERAARSRALAALAKVFAGPAADRLMGALRRLETDPGAADEALALLDALPVRPRRHALCAYAALHAGRRTPH